MKIHSVFLDLDGVICDFLGDALDRHGATFAQAIPGEWHVERWLGITPEQFWGPLNGHNFWANLPWTPDGRVLLRLVQTELDYTPLWFLSTPSDDPGSCSGKYAWMQTHLPVWRRRLILAPSKEPLARQGALLIDDADHNVDAWREAGGTAILVPRLWNSRHAEAERAVECVSRDLRLAKEA